MSDDPGQVPDAILDGQWQSWMDGESPSVEELLRGTPFENNADAQLDLIYNEIVVKEELGFESLEEIYLERYPHLKQRLIVHFEVHRVIHHRALIDTFHDDNEKTWPIADRFLSDCILPLENYAVIRELGHGGMAIVYEARHLQLRRIVALKMFQPGRSLSKRDRFRIRTEAEAIARLSHPNIIQIYEIGEYRGIPFLALELAPQGTLAQKLQRFPYSADAAALLIETLARALQHAHDRQVIHRDLKPANILFASDGAPKISDFGLAKVFQEDDVLASDATRTGETMGTPRYMAPEQAAGQLKSIGPATDIYALGNILYECLTGRAPFVSASVSETLQKIGQEDPLPLRRLQPLIHRDLETICLRCLEKQPNRRYATAKSLAEDLRRFLEHRPILARPTPLPERIGKWYRRRPAQATLVGLVIFASLFGVTATVARGYLESERIESLRNEIAELMKKGRESVDRDELDVAQAAFHSAWIKVHAEPALQDHETSVAGWLDHTRKAANRYQWKQRNPPRDFDHRRDEALLASMMVVPYLQHPERVARDAVEQALQLTIPHDFAWELEREQLFLLDVDIIRLESGPVEALNRLDETIETSSRRVHECRAALLDDLGRHHDADQERSRADEYPPCTTAARFHSGLKHLRRGNFQPAIDDFNLVLMEEPDHFSARLFDAICCLHLNRPREANVALTACLAQRPGFQWSRYFRALGSLGTGDSIAAKSDLERSLAGRMTVTQEFVVRIELGRLCLQHCTTDDARYSFQRAMNLLPDEPSGRLHLAWAQLPISVKESRYALWHR